ncbi:MAG: acyltransferase family protein [Candidatus Saccharimonadales bacterium]
MQWLIGLNSLRAIAIVLIIVYHFFRGFLPGGFVGVEVFFAISGFLIATKLLREQYKGGISYGRFIWTRLKRIFPTLFLCIVVTLSLGNFADRDMMTGARENTLGAATFSTNVVEIVRGGSYEAELIPNVFGHTWFLAVEMQFYLLFPILVLLVLPLFKKRKRALKVFAGVCFGFAVVSMGLMALYGAVLGAGNRAYFGLDSHVEALMLGAGLGVIYILKGKKIKMPKFVAGAGLVACLGGIIAMSFLVSYNSALTFAVALPVTAVLSTIMICCVLALQKKLARPRLPIRVLEWLGSISFGLYLFHYPIYLLLPSLWQGLEAWVYAAIAIVVSFVLAILTYVFVESGKVFLPFYKMTYVKFFAAALGMALLVYLPINTLIIAPEQSSIAEQLEAEKGDDSGEEVDEMESVDFGGAEKLATETKDVILPYFAAAASLARKPVVAPSTTYVPPVNYVGNASVLVIGDSVTLGAKSALESAIKNVYVDAKESRFIYSAAGILANYKARGNLPKVIVISLVTNYYNITDAVLANIVNIAPECKFVFVTGYAGPNQPRETQNAALKSFAAGRANVYVADWWAVARNNWGLMYADHIHLQLSGRTAYANLIVQTIGGIN